MSSVLGTYSGRDLNFTLQNPISGSINVTGVSGQGIAQITVRKTVIQSSMQVGMDGAVVPSVIPGDQGEFEIQVWQTSSLQQQFVALYNAIQSAELQGDVSNWFGTTILITNTVSGASHLGTGCAPTKVPDVTYGDQASRVTWVFSSANVVTQ